jgi:hypothetical protein
MVKEHVIIFTPGLGGETKSLAILTSMWPLSGLTPIMLPMVWKDNLPLKPKLDHLLSVVDSYLDKGHMVSGVGTSAGGSLILNAFYERPNMHRVATVNSRLMIGPTQGWRSFDLQTRLSPAFAESIRLLEKRLPHFPKNLSKRIINTRNFPFDELVPPETSFIEGAEHYSIPGIEHMLGIGTTLTLFSIPLINFLKRDLE